MPRLEADLYAPLKAHLEGQGFAVKGEMHHADLIARNGGMTLAVELKLKPSIKLMAQALDRRRLTPLVAMAVERPAKVRRGTPFADFKAVAKELGLGLFLVSFGSPVPLVQEILPPKPGGKLSPKRAARLEKEWAGRSGDDNVGGSTRKTLITAYRERAIAVAALLAAEGPLSPKEVTARLGGDNVGALLRQDYYHWFEKKGPALYGVSDTGRADLEGKFGHLYARYRIPRAVPEAVLERTVAVTSPKARLEGRLHRRRRAGSGPEKPRSTKEKVLKKKRRGPPEIGQQDDG